MMKTLKIIFFALVSLVAVTACENYSDTPVEYSAIYPLSGEWRVKVTDLSTNTLVTQTMYTFGTYNTSSERTDSMWIRTTGNIAGGIGTLRGKTSCNLSGLTFEIANAQDLSVTTSVVTFSITEGKIILNGVTMPSGVKADKISFKLTTSKAAVAGKTFLFEGYRRTLWPEDETFRDF